MLFFAVEYVYGCSVHILLFRYGNNNWYWYFLDGIYMCNWYNVIDPIFEMELVYVIGIDII